MLALFQQTIKIQNEKENNKQRNENSKEIKEIKRSQEAKKERKTANLKTKRSRVNRGGGKRLRRKQGIHSANKQTCAFFQGVNFLVS